MRFSEVTQHEVGNYHNLKVSPSGDHDVAAPLRGALIDGKPLRVITAADKKEDKQVMISDLMKILQTVESKDKL